jgi:hypothetical protein
MLRACHPNNHQNRQIGVRADDYAPGSCTSKAGSNWLNARVESVDLPAEMKQRLLALMGQLRLVYGAIDMRLTPEGRYVFLEINPAGQWLFVEERSGQPITYSLAIYCSHIIHKGRMGLRKATGSS